MSSRVRSAAHHIWEFLPEPMMNSGLGVITKRTLLKALPNSHQRVVTNLRELDECLRELDEAGSISDDALRAGFLTFRMQLDLDLPPDPYSPEYRGAVLDLYEWVRGKPYDLANERTAGLDATQCVASPFPYRTRSSATVGDCLVGLGHIIRLLDLPPESHILELGAGWGNLSLALVQMGHRVTAIDIDPNFIDLIDKRAKVLGLEIDARVGDFSIVHDLDNTFDAVIFVNAFHHSADHLHVLKGLRRVTNAGGRVFFAGEPITKSFPCPWGLRLDGEALWAIRTNGWMELGFQRSYFLGALHRCGWDARRVAIPSSPPCEVFIAT